MNVRTGYNDLIPLDYDMDGDSYINSIYLVEPALPGYVERLVEAVSKDNNLIRYIDGMVWSDRDIDNDSIGDVKDLDMDADGMSDQHEVKYGCVDLKNYPVDWGVIVSNQVNGEGWQNPYIYNARYAVIIAGGGQLQAGEFINGNHPAFWNDGTELYNKLVNDYKYMGENVYLLHSRWRNDEPDHSTDPRWYSNATYDDIASTFDLLGNKTTINDFFFFVEICHGSDTPPTPLENGIFRNDPNEFIYFNPTIDPNPKKALTYYLDKLQYARMCVVLQSCFPGGREYLFKGDRIVITASAPDQYTYAEIASNSEHWAFIHEGHRRATLYPGSGVVLNEQYYSGFTMSLGTMCSPQSIAYAFDGGSEAVQHNYQHTGENIWDDARSTAGIQAPSTANAWYTYL